MGQYYKQYVEGADGVGHVFCPQNAICKTANGIKAEDEIGYGTEIGRPEGYWDMFSGLKLMEHSWIGNDFVNGVLEAIWDEPSKVAWVGDYANDADDFGGRYTEGVYAAAWGDGGLPEEPFAQMPTIHRDGYLADLDRGEYVDLAEYVEVATFSPRWDKGCEWCIHPLPLLTAIGNGRGGGDYRGSCMGKVGAWAMDRVMYTQDASKLDGLEKVDAEAIAFKEE